MSEAHHEKPFENYVVEKLVGQGWLLGDTSGYDKDFALYPEDLLGWVKDTQSAKWDIRYTAAPPILAVRQCWCRVCQYLACGSGSTSEQALSAPR
ncbi:hypothetical protein E2493_20145 [Sphingomonas parva]|uniref:Uncharacterized protein n=1 Tax=Sphingomonas parva TaxID=2555898 RepID=A0A4Y8ZPQ1_9SPHN|nr:hypothetical protein E2493_20145 [Sphingomonas parva]